MSRKTQQIFAFAATLSLTALLGAPAAQAEWKIGAEDGSSIKFGFLAQMRGESISPDVGSSQNNLFFRRLRLLAGGKINDQWSFFFETDSPNLGKGESDGTKNNGDIYIQDFVVTYKPKSDAFMLDFGQLLPAVTYNSNQSAVSLMATDYGATSFVWNGPLNGNVGRDYGVRARGYLMNDHLEYRASILGGQRGTDSTNSFRMFGRLMYNFFEPHKGLYYTGTSLGKKKVLSVGASVDTQEDYQATSVDVYWDQPLGGGNALTLQGSWSSLDGDVFLTSLPEQDNMMVEAGFYLGDTKLLPFVQYTSQDFSSSALSDVETTMVGLGYFFRGHGGNVKLSWGNTDVSGGASTDVIWLQLQGFSY